MACTLTRCTDDQHLGRPRLIHLGCELGLALFIFYRKVTKLHVVDIYKYIARNTQMWSLQLCG